jgi:hypothetical protein
LPLTVRVDPLLTVVFDTDKTWPCEPLIDAAEDAGIDAIVIAATKATIFLMAKL